MHTAETSSCAHAPAAAMVKAYHARGYRGVVITDHFVNASNVSRGRGPWQAQIDVMLRGFQAAKAAGDALGVAVLCGCEWTWEGADFLTYGVGEAFWRDQPDLVRIDADAYVRRVHGAGGLVCQAHPFREAAYLPPDVPKRWDIVDAVEVFNGSHLPEERAWDRAALAMALEHGVMQFAGSDAHTLLDVATAGIDFDDEIVTESEWLSAVREGRYSIVCNVP